MRLTEGQVLGDPRLHMKREAACDTLGVHDSDWGAAANQQHRGALVFKIATRLEHKLNVCRGNDSLTLR
jgi:hypothetical protein